MYPSEFKLSPNFEGASEARKCTRTPVKGLASQSASADSPYFFSASLRCSRRTSLALRERRIEAQRLLQLSLTGGPGLTVGKDDRRVQVYFGVASPALGGAVSSFAASAGLPRRCSIPASVSRIVGPSGANDTACRARSGRSSTSSNGRRGAYARLFRTPAFSGNPASESLGSAPERGRRRQPL